MVYILVPVFKRVEKTQLFLESLKSIQDSYTVIICDDSPAYEHFDKFDNLPYIHLVKGNGQLYWGGGINCCVDYLNTEFVLRSDDKIVFANNDIQLDKQAYKIINSQFDNCDNCIYHPKLIDQDNNEISAGSRIRLWFPFITKHVLANAEAKSRVDLASARFLLFSRDTLMKLNKISTNLPHYGGDNDFVLRAKKHGIKTYIVNDALCYVDESQTGAKQSNIKSFKELVASYSSIKSPNCIKYRFNFVSNHFNPLFSFFIVASMTVKSFLYFLISR